MSGRENIVQLSDTDEHYIYLVWGIGKFADGSSAEMLYAVDTTEDKAEQHKLMANQQKSLGWPKIDRVFVEKRWTNHFFGESLPIRFQHI